MQLTLPDFVSRWKAVTLSERSAAQSHFIDLCDLLGQPHPAAADQTGENYVFEKGVSKSAGGKGYADVWMRGHFAWEYKGKHKDLSTAYQQLLQYREDLDNPPLLVVCDLDRFQVHINFTGLAKHTYQFDLDDLLENQATTTCDIAPLEVLRALFLNPGKLRPEETAAHVTEKAAAEFAKLAESLRSRGEEPQRAAHFLMRLLFCLFAEDIGLLPNDLFSRLIENNRNQPAVFGKKLKQLFAAMAFKEGSFGPDDIHHFNGGLFTDESVIDLVSADLHILSSATKLDWASIEPAIFGTLFERSLDPSKRSQLGAHYTSKEDILLVVEPVLMQPLRHRWKVVQAEATEIATRLKEKNTQSHKKLRSALRNKLLGFADELSQVRILDPACGSGNFLYLALKRLLDLWKEVSVFAAENGLSGFFPYQVRPSQLYGLEINVYAHELASVVVWIGYIQWLHDNGFGMPPEPILERLTNIERRDAVLQYEDGRPVEPEWPESDVVIGNPPFLGGKKLRAELGDHYVEDLFKVYDHLVAREADLVVYWFEKTRKLISEGKAKRAGLLATQSIRSGVNRETLQKIKESGDIFFAWADRPWILDGASVRVAMVGFDNGDEQERRLDGASVSTINSDLSSSVDLTQAEVLPENDNIAFQGPVKVGHFELTNEQAMDFIRSPNPNGRSNADVIKPWMNASDITGRSRGMWIIDFGEMDSHEAALFERPFEYVKQNVEPFRKKNNDLQRRTFWWRLGRSGSDLRAAKAGKTRLIITPRVAKHRIFVWADANLVPDSRLFVFSRDDDYFFGVLHSRVHETWSLNTCSWHGVGNDPTYNTSSCFKTFPFPWPPGKETHDSKSVRMISDTAKNLVEKRDTWLSPNGLPSNDLKLRTLTNLYNARPTWLDDLHRSLDSAVLQAYGWSATITDNEILQNLLALNQARAKKAVEGQLSEPPG
jgi:type II restriction/modification system DNA methylase subunit YeeA